MEQDGNTAESLAAKLKELEEGLESVNSKLGKAEELKKTQDSLKETETEWEVLAAELSDLLAALEQEKLKQPEREELSQNLMKLEAELLEYDLFAKKRSEKETLQKQIETKSLAREESEQAIKETKGQAEQLKTERKSLEFAGEQKEKLTGEKTRKSDEKDKLFALQKELNDYEDSLLELEKASASVVSALDLQMAVVELREQQDAGLAELREKIQSLRDPLASKEKLLHELKLAEAKKEEIKRLAKLFAQYQENKARLELAQKGYLALAEGANILLREYNSKNKQFLEEQAGVLAEYLQDGAPCPVCGSSVHPIIARKSVEAPTEEELRLAKKANEDAQKKASEASRTTGEILGEVSTQQTNIEQSLLQFSPDFSIDNCSDHILEQARASEEKLESLGQQIEAAELQIEKKNELETQMQNEEKEHKDTLEKLEALSQQLAVAERNKSSLEGSTRSKLENFEIHLSELFISCKACGVQTEISKKLEEIGAEISELERKIDEENYRLTRKDEIDRLIPEVEKVQDEAEQKQAMLSQEIAAEEATKQALQGVSNRQGIDGS